VLEHIEEDRAALRHMFEILQAGGRLLLLVPAHQSLYCKMDRNLGHFRRYSLAELAAKVREAGFAVEDQYYFNPIGAIGWFVAGKIFRAKEIRPGHLWLQKLLLPLATLLDRLSLPFGLSAVVIGRKPRRSLGFPRVFSTEEHALPGANAQTRQR
ncbi:MAG: hypothetical protein ACPL7D_06750, partial [Candidatus Sumerlaeaceae bacterium]